MKTLDLKTELYRMIDERRGVSDTTAIKQSFKDLATLKQSLQEMLDVRNGNLPLTQITCPKHVGTVCTEHNHNDFSSITKDGTIQDALSIGDIDEALNLLTYCTCNSRYANGCSCQSNTAKDYCSCMGRKAVTCSCQSRDAGKYNHGWADCSCNSRNVDLCLCQGRNATLNCTCEGRCSCNEQKEFSPIMYDDNCACNEQSVLGCVCDKHSINECTYHYCSCVARDQLCTCDLYVGWCGNNYFYNNTCRCHVQGPWTRSYSWCEDNVNFRNYDVETCQCMSRCSCNTQKVLKE